MHVAQKDRSRSITRLRGHRKFHRRPNPRKTRHGHTPIATPQNGTKRRRHGKSSRHHHKILQPVRQKRTRKKETTILRRQLRQRPPHPRASMFPSIQCTNRLHEEYQQHAVVFSEKAAQRFPPAREEDHVITLKPGAPTTLNCKVYPLTSGESEATKEFLKEHLEKGYIVESNSPYASSFFFRK